MAQHLHIVPDLDADLASRKSSGLSFTLCRGTWVTVRSEVFHLMSVTMRTTGITVENRGGC
jgi:hypothetical protein